MKQNAARTLLLILSIPVMAALGVVIGVVFGLLLGIALLAAAVPAVLLEIVGASTGGAPPDPYRKLVNHPGE